MKRSVKNIVLSLLGFSAAPILTACYGMPEPKPDQFWDKEFKGKVTNADGQPIEGVKVYVGTRNYEWDGYNGVNYTYSPITSCEPDITDSKGEFSIYVGQVNGRATFVAEDVDGQQNGLYNTTDESLLNFDGVIVMEKVTPESNTNE